MTNDTDFRSRATNPEAEALEKQKEQRERKLERQTALIFAVLIAVMSGTGIILIATSERAKAPSELSDCKSIESGQARLACFDEMSRRVTREPFKGAPPAEIAGKK